jgi:GAF domain-containing protein
MVQSSVPSSWIPEDRARKFTTDDLNMLTIVANLAGAAIEKARLKAT